MHWFRSGRGASDSEKKSAAGDTVDLAEELRFTEDPALDEEEMPDGNSGNDPEENGSPETEDPAAADPAETEEDGSDGKSGGEEKESGGRESGLRGFFSAPKAAPKEEEIDFASELRFESEAGDVGSESGVFVNSLDELEEEDIPLSAAAKEAEKVSPLEYVRRVMFWGFLAAFVVSMFLMARNLIQKQKATRIYRDIQEEFFSTGYTFDVSEAFRADRSRTPGLEEDAEQRSIRTMTELLDGAENDPGVTGADTEGRVVNEELERMRAALQNLMRRNPEVYGYISVQNTNINYPVTRGEDNDFYLNHAVTGEYNPVGCIFADYECDLSVGNNYNTVFYGHNITTGGSDMFHDVEKFFDAKMMFNSYIYVYTMEGIYIFEPFSVYETDYEDKYFKVRFKSGDQFIDFAKELQALTQAKDQETKKIMSKNLVFTDRDRLLTLSTCTNGYYTQRYALHAKLVATIFD